MDWRERILSDPVILRGKACVRGPRIPAALVLGHVAADVIACLACARELADFEAVAA